MTRYILSRVLQTIASLLAMSLIVFFLARLSGDPINVILAEDASTAHRAEVRKALHLDDPLYVQYGVWLWGAVRGDLGESHTRGAAVTEMLGQRIPATLQLAGASFLVSLVIGLPIGIYAAAWRGSPFDILARLFAVLGQAVPPFWLGLILMLVFGVWLQILPVAGKSGFTSIIMPAVTLGWLATAGIMRLTRSSMLETLDTEYVKLARIKGVGEGRVLWKHALKNAGLPVLTYTGLVFFFLVSGTIIVETVFAWPGVGQLTFQATVRRDFNVVQGAVLFITAVYLVGNLFLDIAYAYLNPRIRYG